MEAADSATSDIDRLVLRNKNLRDAQFINTWIGQVRGVLQRAPTGNGRGRARIPTQQEAAAALNLSKKTIFRHIVLPQTVVTMFPSLSSQFIFLFLTTGLISEIGVPDLTHAGVFIDSRTFRSFEVFITLTGLYILISLMLKSSLQIWFRSTLGKRAPE